MTTTVYILAGASPYRRDDKPTHCAIAISKEAIVKRQADYERWGYYNMTVTTEKAK